MKSGDENGAWATSVHPGGQKERSSTAVLVPSLWRGEGVPTSTVDSPQQVGSVWLAPTERGEGKMRSTEGD